jgi:Caspase domain
MSHKAIVVGVAQYTQSNLRLPNPENDANAVARFLHERCNFEVELLLSPTKREVIVASKLSCVTHCIRCRKSLTIIMHSLIFACTPSQLEQTIERCKPALNSSVAVALFYFSGHGSKYHEKEFMLCKDWQEGDGSPEDIDHAKRKYGVSLEAIIKDMNGAQASIVLLDACRSYFDRAEDSSLLSVRDRSDSQQYCAASDGISRGAFRVLPPTVDACKVLVGYSCSDGSFALDGVQQSKNSPYTASLLKVSPHTTLCHYNCRDCRASALLTC